MPTFFEKKDQEEELKPVVDSQHQLSDEDLTHLKNDDPDDDPVKTLLTWEAPSRPFRQKDKSYFLTVTIITVLLILIALLAQEYLLIGTLMAFAFVVYVLGFNPPTNIEYRVSTQGVIVGTHFYFWDELDSFWFSKKDGYQTLHILTHLRFPAQLILVLGSEPEDKIRKVVARYLPYHEIAPKTMMDTWANLLEKYFPLEKIS